jgi:hypothetical protein
MGGVRDLGRDLGLVLLMCGAYTAASIVRPAKAACRVAWKPTRTIGDGNAQDEDQIKRQKAL